MVLRKSGENAIPLSLPSICFDLVGGTLVKGLKVLRGAPASPRNRFSIVRSSARQSPPPDESARTSHSTMSSHNGGFTNPTAILLQVEHTWNMSGIEVIRLLGAGAFGNVYEVDVAGSRVHRAMKVNSKRTSNPLSHITALRSFLMQSSLQHDHILPISFAIGDGVQLAIISPLATGGDLMMHLIQTGACSLADGVALSIGCSSALSYMHNLGYAHRDVKPDNFLLMTPGCAKSVVLSDFDCAQWGVRQLDGLKTLVGTPVYWAPEIFAVRRATCEAYGYSADVWSLGVTLYCVFCGVPPFDVLVSPSDTWSLSPFDESALEWISLPLWLRNIIRRLIEDNPAERSSSAAVHGYFSSAHAANNEH